jgi:hypothetical protein
MRGGSEAPGCFSSARLRSGTMTGLSATGLMLAIMTYAVSPNSRLRRSVPPHQVPTCRRIPLLSDATSTQSKRPLWFEHRVARSWCYSPK